ncbi:MAG: CaiB/BaiF CoA-transferase family protein [Myxococcota bacterium]|nr:CaiB/BaiF CoA-transferase family protein [Myxococcota bacterium]
MTDKKKGPLSGFRVLELAGIGPGPFCGMVLADLGAEVVRVDRLKASGLGVAVPPAYDVMGRSRRSVAVDMKKDGGRDLVLDLVASADALIEGFRPGVAERLGVGPEPCMERNPALVYGRVTGWGQEGPLAPAAGHDLNYIALTGALHAIGSAGGPPVPPLSLVGDFGGGGMLLAVGVLSALLEASRTGKGQVVDAAMVDGAALLMSAFYGVAAMGMWPGGRGENLLDGGAPFYGVYETADEKYVAIGAIEPKFWAELMQRLGLADEGLPAPMNPRSWPVLRERLAQVFAERTRDEWVELLEGTDTCFAPVLTMAEAPDHPHLSARGSFVQVGPMAQPAPAPRFSRTPLESPRPAPKPGQDTEEALQDWGISQERIAALREAGLIP